MLHTSLFLLFLFIYIWTKTTPGIELKILRLPGRLAFSYYFVCGFFCSEYYACESHLHWCVSEKLFIFIAAQYSMTWKHYNWLLLPCWWVYSSARVTITKHHRLMASVHGQDTAGLIVFEASFWQIYFLNFFFFVLGMELRGALPLSCIPAIFNLIFKFLRHAFAKLPKLTSKLHFSCPGLLVAGTPGMCHHVSLSYKACIRLNPKHLI